MRRLLAAVSLSALGLSGCAVSAGPVIVHSPSLGFESPYLGATLRGDLDGERFVARAEGSWYDAQKAAVGDGQGLSVSALGGAKIGPVVALAGYRWNRVDNSAYTKDSQQWLAELGYRFDMATVAGTYSFDTQSPSLNTYGLRCEVPIHRVRLVSTWERVEIAPEYTSAEHGDRLSLAALWTF